jgi:DNA polymerase-3 subunit gamma/tau
MEKFIVSARKYRPQNFSTVIGQKHITTTLKNAIANQTLAHAFLFCGPRGVGKTTCARILAKTINCENLQPDGEACNQCNSCRTFNEGRSLNIHELDAASNNSVDDMRDLITQVRFAPQEGKYKIYIIDEVHMLTSQAFNAFLKTLEEPPEYAKFILATTEKHKILPTILSRCQIFDFKRITNADTVEHLQEIATTEQLHTEKAALQLIAQKSEGCMRDALSLLDKIVSFTAGKVTYTNTVEHLNMLDEDLYFKLLQALLQQDVGEALLLYDGINSRGFEGDMVLNGFAEVMRNLLICKDPKAARLLDVLEGMQEQYVTIARQVSVSFLVSALQVITDAEIGYRMARNRRLHVEMALIKLCYLQQVIDLAVSPEGKVVSKKRMDAPVAARQRPVAPLLTKATKPAEAKLSIQTPPQAPTHTPPPPAPAQQAAAQQPPMPVRQASPLPQPAGPLPGSPPASTPYGSKKSLLDKLKEEQKTADATQKAPEPVRMPELTEVQQLWDQHTHLLRQDTARHGTVTSLQMAKLTIVDHLITITSSSKLNQKFIEAEGATLLEAIKKQFNNPDIKFAFEVSEEDSGGAKVVEPRYLNSQERFRLMVSEYPAVWDLKEKLKLELGF